MANLVARFAGCTWAGIGELGRMLVFLLHASYISLRSPVHPLQILGQIRLVGAESGFVIFLTALFTGMVLGLQGYRTLSPLGSEATLGSAVALSLIRELGPVVSALMVAGGAGRAMTAELGAMRLTEQIDALELMALDPFKYLVGPKLTALVLVLPLLCAVFNAVAIWGGYFVGVRLFRVSPDAYFGLMLQSVEWRDICSGAFKSASFGVIIAWICCYKGYYAGYGTAGVSRAATQAVIVSGLLILIWDYFVSSVLTR